MDNLKILKRLIIGTIIFIIVLVALYYVWLINGVSKIERKADTKASTSTEFTEEMILDLRYVAGVVRSKSFKPLGVYIVGTPMTYDLDSYDFEFGISKEDYENNGLDYDSNIDFNTFYNSKEGTRVEEKDKNTLKCIIRINQKYDKEKFYKLKKIYYALKGINDVYIPTEMTNTEIEKFDFSKYVGIQGSSSEVSYDNFDKEYDEAVENLDPIFFATDFENYKQNDSDMYLTNREVSGIAEKGFEESSKRIAGEGADNKESETIKKEEIVPNNYFTRKYNEPDKTYQGLKMEAFVVTRENEMGNGIKVYIDPTTGLIVGGKAFGD